MKARVVFRPQARVDINALYDWIAVRGGAATAITYVGNVQEKAERLVGSPGIGTPHPELGSTVKSVTYRRRTVILYQPDGDAIEILRILHGGRDLRRALPAGD